MKKTFLFLAAAFFAILNFSCSGGDDNPILIVGPWTTEEPVVTPTDSSGGTQPTPGTTEPAPQQPSPGTSEPGTTEPASQQPAEYNVTYVITNGSDDMTGESRSSGKYTAQSELAIPQKEGFVFKGWYSDQEQTQAVASFAGLTGDVTLYGHWAGTLYTVVIEGIDGATLTEGSAAVAGFSTEDTTLSLPAYTKRFYDFAGLYLDNEFNGTAVTQIDKDSAEAGGTLTLYAKWTEKVYTVNYDLLFESGVTNPNTATSVSASTGGALASPIYTDSEFVFAGWYANYSGGTYSNQVTELPVDGFAGDDNSITLHAKWTHATPWTPSGATVRVTTMQTVANDIAALTASEEFYLLVTDTSINRGQNGSVNAALKANITTDFYFDFSAATTLFELTGSFFNRCENFTGITLPDSFNSSDYGFIGTKLKVIKLPDQVTRIPYTAFENCAELETIYLSKNLLEIRAGAFRNCSKIKETYYNSTYEDLKKNLYDYFSDLRGNVYVLEEGRWIRVYKIDYDLYFTGFCGKWANDYKPQKMFIESENVILPTAENVYRAGYDFGGWYDNNRYTGTAYTEVPVGTTNNGKYWAKWVPRNDTPYKVLHYQENLDDSDYTLYETENFTGTTGASVTPTAKDYPGFSAEPVSRQNINEDGKTEMKIYYKRKTVTLTLDFAGGTLDGQTGTVKKTGKIGASVPALSNPQKTNYTFMGWNTNGGALPSVYAEDATFTAVWLLNEVRGIDITVDPLSDISVTKSQSGNTVTFTAQECDSYSWALDGAAKGSARTCSIDTSTLLKGTYTLTLEAKKGGKWFSYTAQIKVN